jgi:hypothetical protein
MTKRIRDWAISDKLYGPDARTIWLDQPPESSEVSEWLCEQRKGWSNRPTEHIPRWKLKVWCKDNNLKQLDYDYTKLTIWFRKEEDAMLWDLSKPDTIEPVYHNRDGQIRGH